MGVGISPQDFVMISVTNVGTRTTVVGNLSIHVGFFRKRRGVITPPGGPFSNSIPCTLVDGERAQWAIELDKNRTWIHEICEGFNLNRLDLYTLRFLVHTSHGEILTIKPEDNLQESIRMVLETRCS